MSLMAGVAATASWGTVTVTTATTPLLKAEWIRPGTHISAMGADKKGKQELPPKLLSYAKLFADYPQQSLEIGEFQHRTNPQNPITAIGDVLLQPNSYRFQPDNITVFDSSGIALQDISIAYQIFSHLKQTNTLTWVDF